MDSGDQRAAGSMDSEAQLNSDVATAHSPDARANAPFSGYLRWYSLEMRRRAAAR